MHFLDLDPDGSACRIHDALLPFDLDGGKVNMPVIRLFFHLDPEKDRRELPAGILETERPLERTLRQAEPIRQAAGGLVQVHGKRPNALLIRHHLKSLTDIARHGGLAINDKRPLLQISEIEIVHIERHRIIEQADARRVAQINRQANLHDIASLLLLATGHEKPQKQARQKIIQRFHSRIIFMIIFKSLGYKKPD